MAPFKINTSAFTIDNLKKEAQISSLKDRSKALSDRYGSPSSSSTGYRPGAAASTQASEPRRTVAPAAPSYRDLPPPARHAGPSVAAPSSVTAAAPPLPPARTHSRDEINQHEPQQPAYEAEQPADVGIDWQNISSADKNALFSVLDGFFGGKAPASALVVPRNADVVAPPLAPLPTQPTATHHRQTSYQQASVPAPPEPQQWARPGQTTQEMSYPPPCHSSSHAHDLANQFSHSAPHFAEAWFTADSPQPPALVGRRDMTWTSSWQQLGTQKTLVGAALFADLSVCWWKVEWDMNDERRPGFLSGGSVRRSARYMDTPAECGADELWDACSTYGEQVAQFAEEAERRGVPVAHGECWDLASEGLASVTGLPAPIPSIARTHGHLLFSGSANGKDFRRDQRGRWRGGDTAIRRGDIVEWRQVRVATERGWADLGAPDHTAVVVATYMSSVKGANTQPTSGQAIAPWEVGILEVVEQSKGSPPKRAEYDLKGMEKGEIWIYRPVGMEAYLGIDALRPEWDMRGQRASIMDV